MKPSTDSALADILSRDIPSAIADAIVEHESWLAAWQRIAQCGLPPGEDIAAEDSCETCRFGRWYAHHSAKGMLEGKLFSDLGRAHRDTHDAGRRLMAKRLAGEPVPVAEYDALMDVADKFRKIAVRVQELHGRPEDGTVAADDDLAELQSRLNMLSELEREWERAARTGSPMSLIMVRPDGLEAVRASHGQVGIDRIVAGLAARMFVHLRPYDSVFRYGRAEFLLCIPGADAAQGKIVAARLDALLSENPISFDDENGAAVTGRFGVSVSDVESPVQEILDRASRAANMTGSAPGQRVVVWSSALEN